MGQGFDKFMENPHWVSYYNNAPSQVLKDYIKLKFDNNPYVVKDKDVMYEEKRKKLESKLSNDDWKYLADNAGSGQARIMYLSKII